MECILDRTGNLAAAGLLVIGLVLVIGGIVISFTNTEGPEWVAKTIAIVVGALITLAGGSRIIHHKEE